MNLQEYILSGILENYVLGLATDEERQEVERYAAVYPEIRAELDAIEQTLETYAFSHAVAPPSGLQTQLLNKLSPVAPASAKVPFKWWWLLPIVLGITYLLVQNFSQQRQLVEKNTAIAQLQTDYQDLERNCASYNTQIALLKDTLTKSILLVGIYEPTAQIVVHWNQKQNKVLLGAINLSDLNANQDYQLWAIINGKPSDMGVIDITQSVLPETQLIEVKADFLEKPQKFAITIEPKGGSAVPSLDKLYLVGNV